MYLELLSSVEEDLASFQYFLPPGASASEIAELADCSLANLPSPVPSDYLDLLREVNGVEWNGCLLYGAHPEGG